MSEDKNKEIKSPQPDAIRKPEPSVKSGSSKGAVRPQATTETPPLGTSPHIAESVEHKKVKKKSPETTAQFIYGIVAFVFLLLIVGLGVYVFFTKYISYLNRDVELRGKSITEISSGDTSVKFSGGELVRLDVYFPVSNEIVKQVRDVKGAITNRGIAEAAVSEFLSGPGQIKGSIVPQGTELLGVYVGSDGIIYLDFTDELKLNFQGDAYMELLLLKALRETVMSNVHKAAGVKLLIAGREVDTLGGHVALDGTLIRAIQTSALKGGSSAR